MKTINNKVLPDLCQGKDNKTKGRTFTQTKTLQVGQNLKCFLFSTFFRKINRLIQRQNKIVDIYPPKYLPLFRLITSVNEK